MSELRKKDKKEFKFIWDDSKKKKKKKDKKEFIFIPNKPKKKKEFKFVYTKPEKKDEGNNISINNSEEFSRICKQIHLILNNSNIADLVHKELKNGESRTIISSIINGERITNVIRSKEIENQLAQINMELIPPPNLSEEGRKLWIDFALQSITQEVVGMSIDISQSTVSNIKNGKY